MTCLAGLILIQAVRLAVARKDLAEVGGVFPSFFCTYLDVSDITVRYRISQPQPKTFQLRVFLKTTPFCLHLDLDPADRCRCPHVCCSWPSLLLGTFFTSPFGPGQCWMWKSEFRISCSRRADAILQLNDETLNVHSIAVEICVMKLGNCQPVSWCLLGDIISPRLMDESSSSI